jgi:hypothetical protein
MDLMSDEAVGWTLIDELQWAHSCDRNISATDVRRALASVSKKGHLGALVYWLDWFAGRAREILPSLKGTDKNSVYQLVALGKQTYGGVLETPDILEFALHQLQDVNLATEVAAASGRTKE